MVRRPALPLLAVCLGFLLLFLYVASWGPLFAHYTWKMASAQSPAEVREIAQTVETIQPLYTPVFWVRDRYPPAAILLDDYGNYWIRVLTPKDLDSPDAR